MEDVNLASVNYNQYVMQEVGRTIASEPQKVVDLLESNDFDVEPSIAPIELADVYLSELPYSDGLQLGTAYLIEQKNSSFTGEIDNENIYDIFDAMSDYWEEEPTSNVGGIVGGIIEGGVSLANKVVEGKQKRQYGSLDLAQKQAESRQALISGIIAQKKAEAEAKQKQAELDAKRKRTMTIAVASVLGIVAVLGVVLYIKKRKNG